MARRRSIAALAALALALAGCSSPSAEPRPTTSQSVITGSDESRAPTPSPTVSETLTPESVTLPDCDGLLSIQQVRVTVNDERVEGPDVFESTEAPPALGPAARETYEGATDTVGCSYGIPYSDGGFYILVATIEDGSAEPLVSALKASDQYEHTTRGAIDMFSKGIPEGIGTYLGYAFGGGAWAIVQGTMVGPVTSVNLAADAVTAVLATVQ